MDRGPTLKRIGKNRSLLQAYDLDNHRQVTGCYLTKCGKFLILSQVCRNTRNVKGKISLFHNPNKVSTDHNITFVMEIKTDIYPSLMYVSPNEVFIVICEYPQDAGRRGNIVVNVYTFDPKSKNKMPFRIVKFDSAVFEDIESNNIYEEEEGAVIKSAHIFGGLFYVLTSWNQFQVFSVDFKSLKLRRIDDFSSLNSDLFSNICLKIVNPFDDCFEVQRNHTYMFRLLKKSRYLMLSCQKCNTKDEFGGEYPKIGILDSLCFLETEDPVDIISIVRRSNCLNLGCFVVMSPSSSDQYIYIVMERKDCLEVTSKIDLCSLMDMSIEAREYEFHSIGSISVNPLNGDCCALIKWMNLFDGPDDDKPVSCSVLFFNVFNPERRRILNFRDLELHSAFMHVNWRSYEVLIVDQTGCIVGHKLPIRHLSLQEFAKQKVISLYRYSDILDLDIPRVLKDILLS